MSTWCPLALPILFGAGDGTFGHEVAYPAGGGLGAYGWAVYEIVVADFNGTLAATWGAMMAASQRPIGINVHLNRALRGCY